MTIIAIFMDYFFLKDCGTVAFFSNIPVTYQILLINYWIDLSGPELSRTRESEKDSRPCYYGRDFIDVSCLQLQSCFKDTNSFTYQYIHFIVFHYPFNIQAGNYRFQDQAIWAHSDSHKRKKEIETIMNFKINDK